jgi:hypothetical protein
MPHVSSSLSQMSRKCVAYWKYELRVKSTELEITSEIFCVILETSRENFGL